MNLTIKNETNGLEYLKLYSQIENQIKLKKLLKKQKLVKQLKWMYKEKVLFLLLQNFK